MAKRADVVVGSVLKVLNNSSLLEDPFPSRNGSFFFGPNQDLTFKRNMPKGFVSVENVSVSNKSFGNGFTRDNSVTLLISFYTQEGIKSQGSSTSNLKNNELVYAYMDLIEEALINNQDILEFPVMSIGDFDRPVRVPNSNSIVGTKAFTFSYRK